MPGVPVLAAAFIGFNLAFVLAGIALMRRFAARTGSEVLRDAGDYAPAPWLCSFTSTSRRSSSDTLNMARGFRFI